MEGDGSWHQICLPSEPGFLPLTLLLLRSSGPCAFNLSVSWVTPSSFLRLCLIPPQTPSFCLAPQHAEFVFALRPCQLFPLPPSSCGFPSSFPDTGALCHLCTLADVFGEAASKPGPALSFGGPDSPHWRAALSTCITFLAEIGARILSALCGEV